MRGLKVSSLLPSNKNRSLLVHSLAREFELLKQDVDGSSATLHPLRPAPADLKQLLTYHDRDYLEHLLGGDVIARPVHSDQTDFGLEEARIQSSA